MFKWDRNWDAVGAKKETQRTPIPLASNPARKPKSESVRSNATLVVRLVWVGLLCNGILHAADSYPPPPTWQPNPEQREHLRRSLTRLNSSTLAACRA